MFLQMPRTRSIVCSSFLWRSNGNSYSGPGPSQTNPRPRCYTLPIGARPQKIHCSTRIRSRIPDPTAPAKIFEDGLSDLSSHWRLCPLEADLSRKIKGPRRSQSYVHRIVLTRQEQEHDKTRYMAIKTAGFLTSFLCFPSAATQKISIVRPFRSTECDNTSQRSTCRLGI